MTQGRHGSEGTDQGRPMSGYKHLRSDREMRVDTVAMNIPGTIIFLAQAGNLLAIHPDPFVLDITRPR